MLSKETVREYVQEMIDFDQVEGLEVIQSLWSGYGELLRVSLSGYEVETVVLKFIAPPVVHDHPRGWSSDFAHQRKLKSYNVERHWYEQYADTYKNCRMPKLLGSCALQDGMLLLLEDLYTAGYSEQRTSLELNELKNCLTWLGEFHAQGLGVKPNDLWEEGTYWHLQTRPQELEQMPAGSLRRHAQSIADTLLHARFQTLVHGDAKYANFCFSPEGKVAAVDFQYVGGGCGMKDVAYFLSCLGEDVVKVEDELLDHYFQVLRNAVQVVKPEVHADELEKEWRALYPYAWADFERFLAGWAPGYWKSTAHAQQKTEAVLRAFSLQKKI